MASFGKFSTKTAALIGKLKLMMGTVTGIALTYGVYKTLLGGQISFIKARSEASPSIASTIQKQPFDTEMAEPKGKPQTPIAKAPPPCAKCQPCVTSHEKAHTLFLCIYVKDDANIQQVASSVAKLQEYVKHVEAPSVSCCGNHRIFAGVGFGPEFYQRVNSGIPKPFSNAKLGLLSKSSVGGDILIHAKSNKQCLLERLTEVVLKTLPGDCVLSHEETYGRHKEAEIVAKHQSATEPLGILNYQYSQGVLELLPLTGYQREKPNLMFVQESGQEDTELKRREAAVDPSTGGSFVMTQRWVHDISLANNEDKVVMNEWVDKAWKECARAPGETKSKPLDALSAELANKYTEKWMSEAYKDCVALQKKHPQNPIICTPGSFQPQNLVRVVRQSVPFRKPDGEVGLFFISYCRTPKQHELLLDRLIASTCSEDKLNDVCTEVFKLSHNVHGACWYFPGMDELSKLV